ncbi:cyclic GMP-AMP synthase isoform X2 [Tachysurus fulvidraco]|uniref:cyclic GMP-AMP synthase isoform X2 n=1 Tax=Tachysurus fulvidraco TaxID=1234273 RepID=UPI001FEEE17F|nr:cyclic GMP-AMP synthase isoform X2 [Tachysurus fulvidraco]
MSAQGRPRKVQGEGPGASGAKSLNATRKKSEQKNEEQKTTDAKANSKSKIHVKSHPSQEVCARKPSCESPEEQQTPKQTRSEEKKVAPRSSTKKGSSIEENPNKELQSAPKKVQKSQSVESESQKGTRLKKSAKDAKCVEETEAPQTAKGTENPYKVLMAALEKLKVKKNERSESAKCVNEILTKIIEHLKRHLDWGKDIRVLKTGSYYENLKICHPDEFDAMMTVSVERVKLQPFSEDGAFYSVEMKRNLKHPLNKFVNDDNTIMASEMLKDFREKIKHVISSLPYDVTLVRKKMGCPAVTLLVKENGKNISIDFVPSLEVHSSWPAFTQDGFNIENWLGKKVRMEERRKPFYLVPKYEGRGNAEQDGIMAKDAWRISFSHVEKQILKNHGKSKTCCEGGQKCCRMCMWMRRTSSAHTMPRRHCFTHVLPEWRTASGQKVSSATASSNFSGTSSKI